MKTGVIYARYSSDTQTEQSIEGQLRVCRDFAAKNDIFIVGEYIDRAMTGTNDKRSDFQRMMQDCKKKQWSVVVVYKLDRFSRNKYESAIHQKTLEDNGAKLVSATEFIPDAPEAIIIRGMIESYAEYYSAELSQKVLRGLHESYLKGQYTGGPVTYGYDVVDKKNVVNPVESEVVNEIFNKYSQGYTAGRIVQDLTARGVKTKHDKYFTKSDIYKILQNTKYNGRVTHGDVEYDNIYPKIIDNVLWGKVSEIHQSNQHAPSRRKEIFDFILSGKLICGSCKQTMVGISGTSKTGAVYYYYTCLSKTRKHIDCTQKAVNKQWLEDLVINATWNILTKENMLNKIAAKVIAFHEKMSKENSTLKSLESKKAAAEKSANNLLSVIEKQGLATDQTMKRMKELEAEISQLTFEIDREKRRGYSFLTTDTIKNYFDGFAHGDINDIGFRKQLVNTFIREVVLYPDQVIITYNFDEPSETHKISRENTENVEKAAKTALSSTKLSSNISASLPPIGMAF